MSNNSNKKEYSKAERLEDAKEWIFKYKGNNIEEFYSKKYNIDNFTAYEELIILEYYKIDGLVDDIFDGDSNPKSYTESQFEFIAGYTSGGAPFGIKKKDNDIDDEIELPF